MTEIKKARKRRRNDPPVKACPDCFAVSMADVRECCVCGHTFHRTTKKDRQECDAKLKAWAEAERLRAADATRAADRVLEAALAEAIADALGLDDASKVPRYAPCNTRSRGEAQRYA
jgi:hypothetical protein